MAVSLRERLGALRERDFRLLFAATTITTAGDRLAAIALAFAVLDVGTAADLGLVFAARQGAQAAILVFGGVVSDRLPRNVVLVGASVVQGAAQAITAGVVLYGTSSIALILVLQAVYGLGSGLVLPAEVGLVPQTVSPARLQQANALQGLTRNVVGILGPAVGGALVVAGSPGVALGVDAISFFVAALLLGRIRIRPRVADKTRSFVAELREGWVEFASRTWLWASVVLFGIGNLAFASWIVLGPVVAKEELGGAGAWATILAVGGIGAVVGSVLALRLRPSRPLVICTLAAMPIGLELAALALAAPVWMISAAAFLAAGGIAVHLTLWFTVFQQQIPERAQSRVASYDTFGSFVLMPLGFALAGPIAHAVGASATLWGALAIDLACWLAILSLPSVWAIRRVPLGRDGAAA